MSKSVLLIGGTRFFGRRLARRLIEEGHDLTLATRGHRADDLPPQVRRLRMDRHDPASMRDALGRDASWDLVYDQMCYSPLHAQSAVDLLSGRCGHYVMASTIEVYAQQWRALPAAERGVPLREEALQLPGGTMLAAELQRPWQEPPYLDRHYGEGKRLAEAVLAAQHRLPWTAVRIAHVLGGTDDFTQRLARYANSQAASTGAAEGRTSFLHAAAIAEALLKLGRLEAQGPLNAACAALSSAELLHQAALRRAAHHAACLTMPAGAGPLPYDYEQDFLMNTRKAQTLGLLSPSADLAWLAQLIDEHLRAMGQALRSKETS